MFGNDKTKLYSVKIKSRLNSGNACYHAAENLLSSYLLSKNVKIQIFKTTVLSVVLCGCENWSLTLREEHIFGMFENRVLGRIFRPRRDEVTGGCRKLQIHNEELHKLYSSQDIIRTIKSSGMRWLKHVARIGR
jgi:hypothetical protein